MPSSKSAKSTGKSSTENCKAAWASSRVQCKLCNKTFSQGGFPDHMRRHTNERPYQCPSCSKSFVSCRELQSHSLTHSTLKDFKCSVCEKAFKSANELKAHGIKHSSERPYTCQLCDKTSKSIAAHRAHQTIHNRTETERNEKCYLCPKSFRTWNIMQAHVRRSHLLEKSIPCPSCKDLFRTQADLRSHQAVHLTDRPFNCTLCNSSFKTEQTLKGHIKIHQARPYKCPVPGCDFKGIRQLDVTYHQERKHARGRPHACPECQKRFTTLKSLRVHSKLHLAASKEARFECSQCKRLFGSSKLCSQHISRMHGQVRYKCRKCEFRTRFSLSLRNHTLSYHTEGTEEDRKKYVCPFCEKRFVGSSGLRIHIRSHTGEKPYSCGYCQYSAATFPALNKHIRQNHTKEHPYNCNMCKMDFTTIEALVRHQKRKGHK